MKKRLKAIIIILMAALLFTACAKQDDSRNNDGRSDGFVRVGEQAVGGRMLAEGENANVSAVKADKLSDGATQLTFEFKVGSRLSGDAEERELDDVPSYNAELLPEPSRLRIRFEGTKYADFAYAGAFDSDCGVCAGSFTEQRDDSLTVYIQLVENVEFRAEEKDGKLIVTMNELKDEYDDASASDGITIAVGGDEQYYCAADLYKEYSSGEMNFSDDLTPVLCADGKNVLMISKGFVYETEAVQFKNDMAIRYPNVHESTWNIIKLEKTELPLYESDMIHASAYTEEVIRQNGETRSLPVLIDNGLYLCACADGGYLYAKRGDSDGENEYEELWRCDKNGLRERVLDFEFYAIESAVFSPNGRRMAVLERTQNSSSLYVFSADTWELISDLSGAGFGNTISGFVWDTLGTRLFAIGGSGTIMLHQYDFSIYESAKRHSVVQRENVDEGSLGFCGGRVYYTYSELESGAWVYGVMPDGGAPMKLIRGSSFAVSPDENYMAVGADNSLDSDGGVSTDDKGFIILNMRTGARERVELDFPVYKFVWAGDSSTVYFFESRLSLDSGDSETDEDASDTPNDPFPYTLWSYDVKTKQLKAVADTVNTSIMPSADARRIYLYYYGAEITVSNMRVTYILDMA